MNPFKYEDKELRSAEIIRETDSVVAFFVDCEVVLISDLSGQRKPTPFPVPSPIVLHKIYKQLIGLYLKNQQMIIFDTANKTLSEIGEFPGNMPPPHHLFLNDTTIAVAYTGVFTGFFLQQGNVLFHMTTSITTKEIQTIVSINHISTLLSNDRVLLVNTHSGGNCWQIWSYRRNILLCCGSIPETKTLSIVSFTDNYLAAIVSHSVFIWKIDIFEPSFVIKPISIAEYSIPLTALEITDYFLITTNVNGAVSLSRMEDNIHNPLQEQFGDLTHLQAMMKKGPYAIKTFGRFALSSFRDGRVRVNDLLAKNAPVRDEFLIRKGKIEAISVKQREIRILVHKSQNLGKIVSWTPNCFESTSGSFEDISFSPSTITINLIKSILVKLRMNPMTLPSFCANVAVCAKIVEETKQSFDQYTSISAINSLFGCLDSINTALSGKKSSISDLSQSIYDLYNHVRKTILLIRLVFPSTSLEMPEYKKPEIDLAVADNGPTPQKKRTPLLRANSFNIKQNSPTKIISSLIESKTPNPKSKDKLTVETFKSDNFNGEVFPSVTKLSERPLSPIDKKTDNNICYTHRPHSSSQSVQSHYRTQSQYPQLGDPQRDNSHNLTFLLNVVAKEKEKDKDLDRGREKKTSKEKELERHKRRHKRKTEKVNPSNDTLCQLDTRNENYDSVGIELSSDFESPNNRRVEDSDTQITQIEKRISSASSSHSDFPLRIDKKGNARPRSIGVSAERHDNTLKEEKKKRLRKKHQLSLSIASDSENSPQTNPSSKE